MRRRRPLIGERLYALKERYSSPRKFRARRLRSARPGGGIGILYSGRPGGHYAARLDRAPPNLAPAALCR